MKKKGGGKYEICRCTFSMGKTLDGLKNKKIINFNIDYLFIFLYNVGNFVREG